MNLYVIRHGEVDANKEGLLISTTNVHLNETGIQQAINTGELLKNLDYNCIIASPLSRTAETANLINTKNKPIIYDYRLIERLFGIYEGFNIRDIPYRQLAYYDENRNVPGGESMKMFCARVWDCLHDLEKTYPHQTIVFVTHLWVSQAISYYKKGVPRDCQATSYHHPNATIVQF